MDLELVSFKLCPFVQRSVITLKRKDAAYRVRYIDLADPPAWFVALSPARKVPILVVDGEDVVFESTVINEFVDEVTPGRLHPEDPLARALNRSWIAFGSGALGETLQLTMAEDAAGFDLVVARFNAKLAAVEAAFGDGPFFNGEDFSLVDAAYAPIFMRAHYIGRHAPVLDAAALPKLAAWGDRLLALDAVAQSVVPDFAALYDALIRRRQGYLATLLPSGDSLDSGEKSRY